VPADELYERYLARAISEVNALGDEIARRGDAPSRQPVLGSGHPLGDIFLLKHDPTAAELAEGVAFYGRVGQAVLKSVQRLGIDPLLVYGTNVVKLGGDHGRDESELAERAECGPEAAFGGGVVERGLERGRHEGLDRRGQALHDADLGRERLSQRQVEAVHDRERVLAHHDHDLGLHDVQLAQEPHRIDAIGELAFVAPVVAAQLDDVRPVHEQRVDAEALYRLQHRLADASVEGDAFGQLRRGRVVLEQEDVAERVPRTEHGLSRGRVTAAGDLIAEGVYLADRTRQITLVELVRRHRVEVRPSPPPRQAVSLRAHREVCGAVRRRHRSRRVHEARPGAPRLPRR